MLAFQKCFDGEGDIKENLGAPAPIAARGEHLDQTNIDQNKCPLPRMKEVVLGHEEHRLMPEPGGGGGAGNLVMHVDAD